MSVQELEKEKNLMTPERKITCGKTARRNLRGGAGQPVDLP